MHYETNKINLHYLFSPAFYKIDFEERATEAFVINQGLTLFVDKPTHMLRVSTHFSNILDIFLTTNIIL